MDYIIKTTILIILLFCVVEIAHTQESQLEILNEILTELKGEYGKTEIKTYKSLEEACLSGYISCNKGRDKIVGFDFQFANLNGRLSPKITQLEDLEYLNLEYNYITGQIPEGFSQLKNLEQLLLNGNFLEGPLPDDFKSVNRSVVIDLAQNSISTVNKTWEKKFNIVNQFNLEGCRSPDSIFINFDIGNSAHFDAVKPFDVDSTDQKTWIDMPRFPGCEKTKLSDEERKNCAQEKMLQFIYKNLRYPAIARENGIEGMVVTQFVIEKNGEVADAVVVRDPGGRCGNASLWIINRMNYICDKWIPGSQGGENVKVQYTLPVSFKLQ